MSLRGFGNPNGKVAVYIENPPPMDEYRSFNTVSGLSTSDLQRIVDECGNHWRKIFNCLAKLMWRLELGAQASWQNYRDAGLLSSRGRECLVFSPPEPDLFPVSHTVHVIAGKTYCAQFAFYSELLWIDEVFARHPVLPLILSPYLDYRQLSNRRIEQLAQLIESTKV